MAASDFEDTDVEPPPDRRRVGADPTLDRLRRMILSGEIPPGAVVSQLKLARDLGVSTTPLREAMRQLQAEGLLEAELNRRPRVPHLDIDDLHAVYAARILYESLAVMMTVRGLTVEDVGLIEGDLTAMRELAVDGSLDAWEAVHARFHRRLMSGASDTMAPTLSNFFDRSERYRHLSVLSDKPRGRSAADEEHQRIVEACAAGDENAAARELATHLARTAIGLSAAFAPEVDPTPVRLAVGLVTGAAASPPPRRLR